MEKIPAACAMQWSIDLDKALRSNIPGRQIKAIEEIGPKLQRWSMEPNINMAVANIFGLVPGEDRTFANTILLRLADAFRHGDNNMRLCILKVFLPERRHLINKGRRYDGFLAKKRVPNHVELLKRVKVVFETGDSEAKALALRLLGCWADFAKDSIQIKQLILSSLRSSNAIEVKASLFAAGSFCLLSEDFAYIILDILVDVICKSYMPTTVLFAAIHTFTKFQCSYTIASKAYRVGKRLVLSPLVDDLKAEMLLSLSKLAARSPTFVAEQVDLLFSVLKGDTTTLLKGHALKSLHFLFSSSAFIPPVNRDVFETLFNIANDEDFPVNLQCRALRTLRMVFTNKQADKVSVDVLDLVNTVLIMVDKEEYSLTVNTYLALHLLVDILYSFKGSVVRPLVCTKQIAPCSQLQIDSQDIFSCSEGSLASFACKITILLINYATLLAKQYLASSSMETGLEMSSTMVKKRCKSLLCLVLLLAKVHPVAGLVALDQVRQLVQNMFSAGTRHNVEDSSVSAPFFPVESCITFTHKCDEQLSAHLGIMLCIFRFTSSCLDILNALCSATPVSDMVRQKLKLLIQCLQESNFFMSVPYDIFCVCMHPYIAFSLYNNSSESLETPKTGCEQTHSEKFCGVTREWQCLEFIKLMLQRRNYWSVYRAGTYACTGGMWFAATLAFRKLIDHLESPTALCWLKCLMLLAGTESELKLLLYPEQGNILVKGLQTDSKQERPFESFVGDMAHHVQTTMAMHSSADKFSRAHSRMRAAEKTLTSTDQYENNFYFQKWFLSHRAKLLEIIVELLELLKLYMFSVEKTRIAEGNGELNNIEVRETSCSLMVGFSNNALKLNKLAKSYDLLATSFIGIDGRSFSTISAMALNCSLLAFCLTFAIYFPQSLVYSNTMASCIDLSKLSSSAIMEDITHRTKGVDGNIFMKLQELMDVSCDNVGCIHLGTRITIYGEVESTSLLFCKFAILSIFEIQENSKSLKDEAGLYALLFKSFQVISEIVQKCMEVPFHVPKYFFKVRPCTGAELYVFNSDSGNKNVLQVSSGFQLSLNVRVQVKNTSPKQDLQIRKLFCILSASPSDSLKSEEPKISDFQVDLVDEMVDLNNLLATSIKTSIERTGCKFVNNGGDLVTSYFCCEPNELGQGFSTCLLDVSAFPVGSYRIKWQSCCLLQDGSYWSLLPLNLGAVFNVLKS